MLIENVEIVFFQIGQELFCLHRQKEGAVGMLGELIPVVSTHIQMLLGIGSDPIDNQITFNNTQG